MRSMVQVLRRKDFRKDILTSCRQQKIGSISTAVPGDMEKPADFDISLKPSDVSL